MKPDGRNVLVTVKGITDEDGNAMESAPHPKQILWVDLGSDVSPYDILRRSEMDSELNWSPGESRGFWHF